MLDLLKWLESVNSFQTKRNDDINLSTWKVGLFITKLLCIGALYRTSAAIMSLA